MYLQFKSFEGVAQLTLKLAYGRAEPCLTTAGRAESNETGLLRQSPLGEIRGSRKSQSSETRWGAEDGRAPTEELRASVRVLLFDWKADE